MPSETSILRRWSRHFIRRVVIPVAVVASVVVASNRVLSSAQIPAAAYSSCMTHLLTANDTPADAMFIGSSRTGASIDTALLSKMIGGGRIDKFVYTGDAELDQDLAIRTYLSKVGAPRVLAIEGMFWSSPDRRIRRRYNEFGPTPRTMSSFSPVVYAQTVVSLIRDGAYGLDQMFVKTHNPSPVRYAFSRINLGWDLATRNPRMTLDPPDTCPWTQESDPEVVRFINGRKFFWIDGKSEPYDEATAKPAPKASAESWSKLIDRLQPMDLDHPFTKQEVSVVDDIVKTALDAGVEHVIIYNVPQYAAGPKVFDAAAVTAAFPDATVFDMRPIVVDPARPLLRQQYFNAYHLNRFGAHEVSAKLGALLESMLGPAGSGG